MPEKRKGFPPRIIKTTGGKGSGARLEGKRLFFERGGNFLLSLYYIASERKERAT